MKYFIKFLLQHKGKLLLALVLLLGQVVGTLLIPALISIIVDEGILLKNMDIILQVGLQMLAVACIATCISVFGSWVTSDLGSLFGREMRTMLFAKIQKLAIQQFNEVGVSSLITRSTSDITHLQQTLGMLFQMVVPAPLIVVVSFVMTAKINATIAMIQFFFMILLVLLATVILKKSNKYSKTIQTRLDRINTVLRESITGVRVIRAFGNELYEEQRSADAYEEYANNMIRLNRLFAIFTPAVWILMGAVMVVVLALGGIFSLEGTMQIGQITAVSEYATLTMLYLMMGVATLTTLPKAIACLKRLQDVLDLPITLKDVETCISSEIPMDKEPVVAFEHVTFSYPGAEEPVIKDLSFQINTGQTVAIIGSTGSGKSTIADVLLRLHDIQEGSILLHGIDIRQYAQHELHQRIGSVPQKSFLFSGNIADNLRMGDAKASEATLWDALDIAQAKDFVSSLPLQLLSPVSQGGTNFSGGQRQRLSIARALVKKADIFVFDDSFSALDVKTDAVLRKKLKEHMHALPKLMIAQRISSILDADQILVLDEGSLVGIGTHETLLKDCAVYRAIADSQMNRKEA